MLTYAIIEKKVAKFQNPNLHILTIYAEKPVLQTFGIKSSTRRLSSLSKSFHEKLTFKESSDSQKNYS